MLKSWNGGAMAVQTYGVVVQNRKISPFYFLLELECLPVASLIKPGQFIMLKTSGDNYPLLRRPFSIYRSYPPTHPHRSKRGRLTILYKKVGKGTEKMTEFRRGQKVDLIGPLGNGFSLPPLPSSTPIILIGGGVGIVSLYPLAEVLKERELLVLIGGRGREDLLCVEDFKKLQATVFMATEDGSLGFKGTVVTLFRSLQNSFGKGLPHYLFTCGPMPMLAALSRVVEPGTFISQASLETRMACGLGACWGCVVRTNDPKTVYQRVCKEGPVFRLEDIVWEEG